MASTNKTNNYDLSQFLGTDKPTWLTDYNGDMSKIDAGMTANKTASESNQTKIDAIESDVDTIWDEIHTIKTGDTQTAQDISTLQTNQQNLQTRMGKAESDIAEIKGEIRKEEEIWIIVDNQNCIGVKDGTYQTGWAGYAMGYLGLTETQVIVRCANDAGVVSTGEGGATYRSLIESAGNAVSVKTRVSRIIIGSLLNDYNQTVTTEISALLALRQWCNLTFPAARVEWVDYYYPWGVASEYTKIDGFLWKLNVAQHIGETGIIFNKDFLAPPLNKAWFDSTGYSYTDDGQHAIGRLMAEYFTANSFSRAQGLNALTKADISLNTTKFSWQNNNNTIWHEYMTNNGYNLHGELWLTAVGSFTDLRVKIANINPSSYWNLCNHDKTIAVEDKRLGLGIRCNIFAEGSTNNRSAGIMYLGNDGSLMLERISPVAYESNVYIIMDATSYDTIMY